MKQKNPKHIAIVMDGNGRWASQRGLPRIEGHRQGVQVVRDMIQCCLQHQIPILSLFTFSQENWARPEEEVHFLMGLFLDSLSIELPSLIEHGVQLRFLGEREGLSDILIQKMNDAEAKTSHHHQLILNIALNYSGKMDILTAIGKILEQGISSHQLDEQLFSSLLSTHDMPNPDLFIRTSGEQRISNFFLWQLAYTELYFTDIFWPDFDAECFAKALAFFHTRERRFGKISQQLQDE